MSFYDLPKDERENLVRDMQFVIHHDLSNGVLENILGYAADEESEIRRHTYLIIGRLYRDKPELRAFVLKLLPKMFKLKDYKVRQTVVYILGEIGKTDARSILGLLEKALTDDHKDVRKAVIGAMKRMGEKNPTPTLAFARRFLHDPDPKIRRQVVHGIELRGREAPEDIIPLLKEVQYDKNKKVQNTIVHVLGQISYKEGCLEKVVAALNTWENKLLVERVRLKILEIHERYEKFTAKSHSAARKYIEKHLK